MKLIRQFVICLFIALDMASVAQTTTAKTTNTPIPEMPNAVTVCTESQACIVTGITGSATPAALPIFQFGTGSTWCQTFVPSNYPFTVSYASPNPTLCAYDPAPGVVKTLVVQQTTTAFTVTVTLAGTTTVVPVPALTPVGPTPVSTFPATCTNYSDTSFICKATGPVVPVTK